MAKILVVLNEQHKLVPDQERTLNEKFGESNWSLLSVPQAGWTAEEQRAVLVSVADATLVFASPVTLMLRDAAKRPAGETLVFHNDKREKKEANGKIFFAIASEGWVIL